MPNKTSLCVNRLSQILHWKGFSLVWILWCLLQLPLSVNVLDSLNRNLVFEVITLTDKIHIQYGDHTYRHVGDRVLKEGVNMSYWVHTLGPVAVRVVHLHTLL